MSDAELPAKEEIVPRKPDPKSRKSGPAAGRRAPPTQTKSSLDRVKDSLKRMFDRTDSSVVAYQDLAKNVVLFSAVIYCMHKYGHKLAL